MLFFDLKIVLIVGLTIVIYFIYCEVETLHSRVLHLEHIKHDNHNDETETNNLTEIKPKKIVVDFAETKATIDYHKNIVKPNNSPKFLEIYSNDNTSLDDAFQLDMYNSLENVNNIEDSIEINNDILEPAIKDHNFLEPPVENHNFSEPTIKNYNFSEPAVKEPDVKIDNPTEPAMHTMDELKNMKLPEVTNIATKNNISLMKQHNGIMKKKIKMELINEIISKKNI